MESLHNPAEGNARSGTSGLGRQAGGGQAVSARKERTVGSTTRSKRITTQPMSSLPGCFQLGLGRETPGYARPPLASARYGK